MELTAKKLKFFRHPSRIFDRHLVIEVEGETTASGNPVRYIVTKTEEVALRAVLDELDGKAGV